jgi:hypothetical protein
VKATALGIRLLSITEKCAQSVWEHRKRKGLSNRPFSATFLIVMTLIMNFDNGTYSLFVSTKMKIVGGGEISVICHGDVE